MAQVLAVDQEVVAGTGPYTRDAMARALRVISPSVAGGSGVQQLYSVPAAWAMHHHEIAEATAMAAAPVPKLQSPRRRGVAPPYPRVSQLEGLRHGTLILFSNGFVLEPADRRHPCVNVASSQVKVARFYSDAFEVVLASRERIVIQNGSVDRIDSIFQAFFWNSMP